MRRFLSVCSGIEAASVAFQPLGWEAVAFAEIESFPCQVLAHHYPQVPNLGDLTRFRDWPTHLLEQSDILCGGTPCQAFSVAGRRGSLDDERGNLTLTFVHLYNHLDTLRKLAGSPPAVCIWENVPGIFSDKQNAFGCFLAGLVGEAVPLQPSGGRWTHAGAVCGPQRTAAWRVLDAQYHGLAQRRQRVVVVASADPAFDPSAVLFEWDGLRRDTPPSREPGQSTAPTLSARAKGGGGLGTDAECDGAVIAEPRAMIPEVCPTLLGGGNTTGVHRPPGSTVDNCESLIPTLANCLTRRIDKGLNTTLDEGQPPIVEVTHRLRGEGFDASEDGSGRGTPLIPVAYRTSGNCGAWETGDKTDALTTTTDRCSHVLAFQPRIARNGRGDTGDIINAQSGQTGKGDSAPCVAFTLHGTREGTREVATQTDLAGTIRKGTGSAIQNSSNTLVQNWAVRRLTCEEAELLQGFPIGYTLLPGKGKRKGKRKGEDLQQTTDYLITLGFPPSAAAVLAHCPDGPRYKALGNSWAVPVFTWVGTRVERMLNHQPLSQ